MCTGIIRLLSQLGAEKFVLPPKSDGRTDIIVYCLQTWVRGCGEQVPEGY